MSRSGKFLATAVLVVVTSLSVGDAHAIPPPPRTLLIFPNGTSPGCYLYPNGSQEHLGYWIDITNNDSVTRTVRQTQGFWSARLAPGKDKSVQLRAAGAYKQTCDSGPAGAPISVKPSAPGHPSSALFTVMWANSGAGGPWRYDVQYRIGAGGWKGWKSNTSSRSATFNGAHGKAYYFRARVRKSSSSPRTAWSPSAKVVT